MFTIATKYDVLKLLEDNKGSAVSGNDIASALNISRAAVWKVINKLKAEGYKISAVTKKGYCLQSENDILSPQSIHPFIKNTELFDNLLIYKSLSSTNTIAKDLANNCAKNGTVVIAEHQTAGKGRLGRQFFAPPSSGIYMSVIFRPDNQIHQSMLITSATAVAVCRAIKKVCDIDCKIKWVNDIYLDSKKLCGILTEASFNFELQKLDYLVIGIGININSADFPPELREIATSLHEKLGDKIVSRSELIGEVLNELEAIMSDLETKSFLKEYKERSFILGCEIDIISPNETQKATAIDINDFGHLVVRLESGEVKALHSNEISIRKV